MSLLVVNGLTKRFGGLRAVADLSFAVEPWVHVLHSYTNI